MMRSRTTTRESRASRGLRITNASIHNVLVAVSLKKIAMSIARAVSVAVEKREPRWETYMAMIIKDKKKNPDY